VYDFGLGFDNQFKSAWVPEGISCVIWRYACCSLNLSCLFNGCFSEGNCQLGGGYSMDISGQALNFGVLQYLVSSFVCNTI